MKTVIANKFLPVLLKANQFFPLGLHTFSFNWIGFPSYLNNAPDMSPVFRFTCSLLTQSIMVAFGVYFAQSLPHFSDLLL